MTSVVTPNDRRVELNGRSPLDVAAALVRSVGPGRALETALEVTRQVGILTDRIAKKVRPNFGDESPDQIIGAVCDYFKVDRGSLLGEDRAKRISHARQVAYRLLELRLGASTMEIGVLTNRDHTSVIHGFRRVPPDDFDVMRIAARLDMERNAEAAE